jgi:hypothetical protein
MKKQLYFSFKVIFFAAILSIGYASHAKAYCSLWFLPCININVFEDLNCNGVMDAGEPSIPGVTINISGGAESNSYVTNVNGQVSIEVSTEGDYSVTETDPSGYISVTPNIVPITAKFEEKYYIYYGDTIPTTLSGVVFEDSDGDGIQHPLDPIIPGVKIDLPISDYEYRSTITDENGWYSFHGLGGGNYTLTEADLPGYISTTPDEVQISVCGSESYVNFGEKPDVVINRIKEGAILSAGLGHTCGVKTDRTVACWGWNGYGQASPPAGKFKSVSAGYYHTCGIRTDGTVTCWGAGTTNTGVNFEHGQSISPSGIFSYVSAGYEHTCGLKPNGDAVCWGSYAHGQTNAPAGIFSQVSAGQFNTCGVATNGDLACWGADYYDQGAPSLPSAGIFSEISAGGYHACALQTKGTAACWGWNGYGQATPPDATTFKQVSVGGDHTCGLKIDGTVTCWGSNNSNQLISQEGTFTQISAGGYHTCGSRTDGNVTCWGMDADGRLTPPSDLVLLTNANGLPWLMLLLE